MYQLSPENQNRLKIIHSSLSSRQKEMLGYPIYCEPPAKNDLEPFLDFVLNNLGDPFEESSYALNTFEIEREVIGFFSKLYNLTNPWGYVTSGGSEGNLKGLSMGLDKYPDGIVYCSNKSHYSVPKAAKLMRAECVEIDTYFNHRMDEDDLLKKIQANKPAILNLNIGTTIAGAIDNTTNILNCLDMKGIKNFYIHCDAALSGLMLPFIEKAPKIDFNLPIDTVSVSGHKFVGCPFPCGVLIARERANESTVDYINSIDSTIFGSRNGLAALAWWCSLNGLDLQVLTNQCLSVTDYLCQKLRTIGWHFWKNPFSNTVVFINPGDEMIQKWQLPTEGPWSHIIVMPHVTRDHIDRLCYDLQYEIKKMMVA